MTSTVTSVLDDPNSPGGHRPSHPSRPRDGPRGSRPATGRPDGAAAAPAAAESDGDDEDDDEEAAPTKQSKYPRKNLSDHNFTLRVQYQGSELPTLHARFDGLSRVGHFVAPQSASVDTFDSAPRLDSRSAAIGRV